MRHIAYTTESQVRAPEFISAAFTRKNPYMAGLSGVFGSPCRQYVMTS